MSDTTAWVKVERRGFWKPDCVGDKLEGVYCGKTSLTGDHGRFDVVQVRGDDGGVVGASGTYLINLVNEAALQRGERIRIVFDGLEPVSGRTHVMRKFSLYVAARGKPVGAPAHLPDPCDPGPREPPPELSGEHRIERDDETAPEGGWIDL
jgi:hypothetical protein